MNPGRLHVAIARFLLGAALCSTIAFGPTPAFAKVTDVPTIVAALTADCSRFLEPCCGIGPRCDAGLECHVPDGGAGGTCLLEEAAIGETCHPWVGPCEAGSVCALETESQGTCASCGDWLEACCGIGTGCGDGLTCRGDVCHLPLAREAETCNVWVQPCQEGLTCSGTNADGDGVCRRPFSARPSSRVAIVPRGGLDEACHGDGSCDDGLACYRGSDVGAAGVCSQTLEFATFNVQFFPSPVDLGLSINPATMPQTDARAVRIGQHLAMADLDIIVLNEAFNDSRRKIIVDEVRRGRGVHYEAVSGPPPDITRLQFDDGGLAILTRLELVNSKSLPYSRCNGEFECRSAKGILWALIEREDGSRVHVFATHLNSNSDDEDVDPDDLETRMEQLEEASAWMAERVGNTDYPIIFAGDFNIDGDSASWSDPRSEYYQALDAIGSRLSPELVDLWPGFFYPIDGRSTHRNEGWTYTEEAPTGGILHRRYKPLRFDWILSSASPGGDLGSPPRGHGLTPISIGAGPDAGPMCSRKDDRTDICDSDHVPVRARFAWPSNGVRK